MPPINSSSARLVPLIGRDQELTDISNLLSNPACRLVTLTGPGGIGKTSLATELSYQLYFKDGIYFVPLQPLHSGRHVLGTLTDALPFHINSTEDLKQQLINFLSEKHLLLILDNFEHLLDGAELLVDIFAAAPQVKILTTSREPLNLREEWVRQLKGLSYPDLDPPLPIEVYSAVQLFAERALQHRADFRLEDEAEQIAHICQIVEGIPLAIELAATWVRTLSCAAIAAEIQERIDFLTTSARNIPERHRSMRAVFDHSWKLLNPEEARVMRGFVVFRGGCALEAAREVLDVSLPTLASLVDKSLLRHNPETGRYDVQELQRQYAEEQLEACGEGDQVRDRHCRYYAATFHAIEEALHVGAAKRSNLITAVNADLDNLRASWHWALEHEYFDVIDQLLETLWIYFNGYSAAFEMNDLYKAAQRKLSAQAGQRERAVLGRVLARQAKWETVHAHIDHAEQLFKESIAIALEQNRLSDYYYSQRWLGWFILGRHRLEYMAAREILEECITFYRSQGDIASLILALGDLAEGYRAMGQLMQAKALYLESYRLSQEINSDQLPIVTCYLAQCSIYEGFWDEAEGWLALSLEYSRNGGSNDAILSRYALSTQVTVMQGKFEDAQAMIQETRRFADEQSCLNEVEFQAEIMCRLSTILIADAGNTLPDALRELDTILLALEQRGGAQIMLDQGQAIRGWILCGLKRFDEAAREVVFTLQQAQENSFQTANGLLAIVTGARILAEQSKANLIQVVECLGFSFKESNTLRAYLKQHLPTTQLCAALTIELGAEIYRAAWNRGAQFETAQVADALLDKLAFEAKPKIAPGMQPLIEVLTEREVEILHLLADGLNSREIAEGLVLTVGTIRWYVKEIYSKLHVHSRSEAITRAKALKLIL